MEEVKEVKEREHVSDRSVSQTGARDSRARWAQATRGIPARSSVMARSRHSGGPSNCETCCAELWPSSRTRTPAPCTTYFFVGAVFATVKGRCRLMLAHFAWQRRRLAAADVWRVADDQIEGRHLAISDWRLARNCIEQVAFDEFDTIGNTVPRGVVSRHLERGRGNISSDDMRSGQFVREHNRDATRAGADICNSKLPAALCQA